MQKRLTQAGHGYSSSLNHALHDLETRQKSTLRGPPTRANHFMCMEFASFLATMPVSRLSPATPTQRALTHRSCRSQGTTFVHVSSHEARMVAGRAQCETASAEAWQGASYRMQARVGGHQGGWVQ